ncbi:hypothetical protein RRG08_044045 [Elysia crispata]|uniref:Uncharacterized protein n=1 Tax=Elysia crispata TaxID=231223 RepID=A0AAE0Y2X8_9GAST|nr:hypothetical protein RRG08_044045 [Elysia crispata]
MFYALYKEPSSSGSAEQLNSLFMAIDWLFHIYVQQAQRYIVRLIEFAVTSKPLALSSALTVNPVNGFLIRV